MTNKNTRVGTLVRLTTDLSSTEWFSLNTLYLFASHRSLWSSELLPILNWPQLQKHFWLSQYYWYSWLPVFKRHVEARYNSYSECARRIQWGFSLLSRQGWGDFPRGKIKMEVLLKLAVLPFCESRSALGSWSPLWKWGHVVNTLNKPGQWALS